MSPFDTWPIDLTVYGKPRGKARPRFNPKNPSGRPFTPDTTAHAERDVRGEWKDAGCPFLDSGPLEVLVDAYIERPQAHFTSKGAFTAKALREPYPTKTPDVDNVWKLVMDALNGRAFPDDRYVVRARIDKRWCGGPHEPERPHVRIRIRPFDQATRQEAAA
jgi:Holliday junction resolvase RusA-like endonuclease